MIKFEALGNIYMFDKHVNLICGVDGISFNSGTYKTYFFSSLENEQRLGTIKTDNWLSLISDPYVLADVKVTPNHCVIIDEANFAPKQLMELLSSLQKDNAYVAIITRLSVKQLVVPVDAIYKLNTDFGLEPVF